MLAWNANTDQVAGYKVYVGTQPGTYSSVFNVGKTTTYTFTSAVAGQRYCFTVTAYASASVESVKSSELCGYSDAPPTLTNPGNQSSTVGQSASLQLKGTDPELRPLIYSASGLPAGLSLMASTGVISGTGTTAGTYNVTARASDGVSTVSQSFAWTMGAAPTPTTPTPTEPVRLSARTVNRDVRDTVRLTWTKSSWGQVWVYRNYTLIAQLANGGSFTNDIRRASGNYTFTVCAPGGTDCTNSVTVTF